MIKMCHEGEVIKKTKKPTTHPFPREKAVSWAAGPAAGAAAEQPPSRIELVTGAGRSSWRWGSTREVSQGRYYYKTR